MGGVPVRFNHITQSHSSIDEFTIGTRMSISIQLALMSKRTTHTTLPSRAGTRTGEFHRTRPVSCRLPQQFYLYHDPTPLSSQLQQNLLDPAAALNASSRDARTFSENCRLLNRMWMVPLQIVLSILLLGFILESAPDALFASGLFFGCAILPTLLLAFLKVRKSRERSKVTETRSGFVNEMLSGLKIIKFFAWEAAYKERILNLWENTELGLLKTEFLFSGLSLWLLGAAPGFVTLAMTLKLGAMSLANSFMLLAIFCKLAFPCMVLGQAVVGFFQWRQARESLLEFCDDGSGAGGGGQGGGGQGGGGSGGGGGPGNGGGGPGKKGGKNSMTNDDDKRVTPGDPSLVVCDRVTLGWVFDLNHDANDPEDANQEENTGNRTSSPPAPSNSPNDSPPHHQQTEILVEDLDLRFKQGQCILLSGSLGAGKTSFLRSLFGDHISAVGGAKPALLQGSIRRRGKLLYVPQVPTKWSKNCSTIFHTIVHDGVS